MKKRFWTAQAFSLPLGRSRLYRIYGLNGRGFDPRQVHLGNTKCTGPDVVLTASGRSIWALKPIKREVKSPKWQKIKCA